MLGIIIGKFRSYEYQLIPVNMKWKSNFALASSKIDLGIES